MTEEIEFDPARFPRQKPAWSAAVALLSDGEWHRFRDLRDAMLEASDLMPISCETILREARRSQVLQAEGVSLVDRRYRVHRSNRPMFDILAARV